MAKGKEFDKDYIFGLIMPSSAEGAVAVAEEVEVETPVEAKAEPVEKIEVVSEEEQAVKDSLTELKSKLFVRPEGGVPMTPNKNLVLLNLMEQLVVERLDAAFEKFHCCQCDKCKKDVAALALNTLPARYVLTDMTDLDEQYAACDTREISGAVIKAILYVKNHPNH